ncbi:contractile injection system tape measure protein [Algoriphagus halophilus]|uniref:contractile injection system tape measure protein n=1 Tax=Algoriphagus halophilus TaxID=226505 RepID=UPI00358F477A
MISQIYLKLKVEQSSQLDSRIKSHFLKHLESIQDAASVNKEAELFRWSETFGFLKERGFLPWWSPIKNLSVFLMEYITLVDHATDSQRKLLRYQLDSRTLESLLSKQGLIQRNTILLLLKNTKKLSQEIPDFQQLIASFDDPGNSKNELKRNLEIQKYSKDEEVKFHQTSKTNLLETLEVAGNEYLEPLREMLLKFGDRRVFESLFSDSRQKEYILTLLELAPFVYIKNVNPAKWRWLVYSFAWFQVRSGNSQIDSRYYLIFYHYLLKNFSGYPWKSILHQAYKQDSFKSRVAPELVMSIEQFLKVELMEENNSVDLKEGDQMFVKNAGLVLCWPFLTMLFTKLEWLENASFVSPEAQHRACHLLQYIAYGHTDFPEYELVLNKFLTGISPEEHLEAEIVLTEHEKAWEMPCWEA